MLGFNYQYPKCTKCGAKVKLVNITSVPTQDGLVHEDLHFICSNDACLRKILRRYINGKMIEPPSQ